MLKSILLRTDLNLELIDVPQFGWEPENSVLGLSAFVDFEITGFAFFRTEFRVDRVLPIWYGLKYTVLPHSNNLDIYSPTQAVLNPRWFLISALFYIYIFFKPKSPLLIWLH